MSARSPIIVAELSANHFGDLERAYALVDAAANAGADAVKLQVWHTMSFDPTPLASGPWAGWSLPALYDRCRLPWGYVPLIMARAVERGIECFASVFDLESLAWLEQWGCPRYKIASPEITDLPLIQAVASTGKPLIISTGMARYTEIDDAMDMARAAGCVDLTLLKCTSSYPAPAGESNLATMDDMRQRFTGNIGLSDHTLGIAVAVAATALGAAMIEKHLTLSRAHGGPDAGFSSEPEEFKAMVAACRDAALAVGAVHYGPTSFEATSLQYRRGLYFSRDLPAGSQVGGGDVRTARPARGIAPRFLGEVVGMTLRASVAAGQPVSWTDLEEIVR